MVPFRTAPHRTQFTHPPLEHNLLRRPLPLKHPVPHRPIHRRIPHNRHPMPPLHTHRIQPGMHPTLHHTQHSRISRHKPLTHLTAHTGNPATQTIHEPHLAYRNQTGHAHQCVPPRAPWARHPGASPTRNKTGKHAKRKATAKGKTNPQQTHSLPNTPSIPLQTRATNPTQQKKEHHNQTTNSRQ